MTGAATLQTTIAVPDWYRDHHFDGRAILPSVEAMALLAGTVRKNSPDIQIHQMTAGRFSRFLELSEDIAAIEATVELSPAPDNRLRARLLTRKQFKAMSRMISHCELLFGGAIAQVKTAKRSSADFSNWQAIETKRIYRELVPFGPTFRSLQDRVYLTDKYATATVRGAPTTPFYPELGSPFCLDGAMHAACVHGQRLVDFVPFPVAFEGRTIFRPTRHSEDYDVEVRLQQATADELVYDLLLWDRTGELREMVTGLSMRDVSSGHIHPPAWIKNTR